MSFVNNRIAKSGGGFLLLLWMILQAPSAWPQASWVGDVIVDGEPSNLWADCLPCTELNEPPNTNWSTDRIPGDDGPLGDPGTGAVIGPDFVVDHNGGTLDLSTLDVQGALIVGGLINISDSATINNIDLESGGGLAGPGPVTLTGAGTWNGFLRSGGGVTNQATLTVATGDLQADLVNSATLSINPSLDFTSTPSMLTNDGNGNIVLNTDTALNNNSNILDRSGAANLLLNRGLIDKRGNLLSVIEVPGNHADGIISASTGTLRFFRNGWQFSGGNMLVGNNGQIELTGQVDHVINGTSAILGEGRFWVNMNTFGRLTVTQPFIVDLSGSGDHGLLLEGIGINLEAALTNRQGGLWSRGTISGAGNGMLVNRSPFSDPFRIVPGGNKRLEWLFETFGHLEQSDTVNASDTVGILFIHQGGGLHIVAQPTSVDWLGAGAIANGGEVDIGVGAQSTMAVDFSQGGGGLLRSQGELRLRGGGAWSGATRTVLAGESGMPAISFEAGRFDFMSGLHDFVDLDSAPGVQELALNGAELIAADGATVSFNLDEGEFIINMNDQAGRVKLTAGGLGGAGRFENQGLFVWQGGEFGVDGNIDFINAAGGDLFITNSGNLLDGRLENNGQVLGGVFMRSASIIENSGVWALISGQSIGVGNSLSPGTFSNRGVLGAFPTTTDELRIDARLDNSGTVRIDNGGTLRLTGPIDQLQNGVLSGGTWVVGQGAMLVFPESFDTIGPGTVVQGLQGIDDSQVFGRILGGSATVTGDFTTNGAFEIIGGGRITVDGQSSVNVPGGVQNGEPGGHVSITEMLEEALVILGEPPPEDARVTASAAAAKTTPKAAANSTLAPILTTPLFDNHAILAPGGIGLAGPFNLDGELVMHPGSTLDIDIAGATPLVGHDQLFVTGPMALAGTVQITVAEGFFPAVGQQFVIATAGQGMTGMIDDVVNANREDIVWSITETADEVIVEAVEVERIFESGFES